MSFARRVSHSGMLVAFVLGMAGCARPPQEAIVRAKAALKSAAEAEAPTYATDEWEAAQKNTNDAIAEVDAQRGKLALLRSYAMAEKLLAAAETSSSTARRAAEGEKQRIEDAVDAAMTSIEQSLVESDNLLGALADCPRRPKGFAGDLEALRGTIEGLRVQLGETRGALADGELKQASSLAEQLKGGVDEVLEDLRSARAKLGC